MTHSHAVALLLLVSLAGCPAEPGGEAEAPSPNASSEAAPAGGLPAGLFLAQRPEGAEPLAAVKGKSKVGDEVLFEARVGGRAEPFVEGRAVFNVADPALPSCKELEGDGCATPWDYCCEDPQDLLKQVATVRVVGDDGRPLEVSLQGEHGLEGLSAVVVKGKVVEADASGVFVIDASGLWVGS